MSYGPHPNDFLFIECMRASFPIPTPSNTDNAYKDGFCLEENESDALFLDGIIFKDFTVAEKEELIFEQYHGYVLRFPRLFHASVSEGTLLITDGFSKAIIKSHSNLDHVSAQKSQRA
jgi:hypothetical protein